jgi:hypothetical protein
MLSVKLRQKRKIALKRSKAALGEAAKKKKGRSLSKTN